MYAACSSVAVQKECIAANARCVVEHYRGDS
jgi:hypothetical protein